MKRVVIIGGGVIGLTSAYYLSCSGCDVTVLDALDFSTNCSVRNAGFIVPSHFVPLASPGIVIKGLKWSLLPKSPLSIVPSKGLLKWGKYFLSASSKKYMERSFRPLYRLNSLSLEFYRDLCGDLGFKLETSGMTMFVKNKKTDREEMNVLRLAESLGLDVEYYNKNRFHELEPNLSIHAYSAFHYRTDASLNPETYINSLKSALNSKGVKCIANARVINVDIKDGRLKSVQTTNDNFTADDFVICSGTGSASLFRLLGVNIPLQPGKGYSFDNPNKLNLKHPAILVDGRVAISLLDNTTRISGAMEIGARPGTVRMKKVKGLVDNVNAYFPDYNLKAPLKEEVWHGHRPLSADGLPYIGPVKGLKNLFVATGHSMMGISLAAITGKLIKQLVGREKTLIDLKPFLPERFSGSMKNRLLDF